MRHSTTLIACLLPPLLGGCVGLHSSVPMQQQYVLSLQTSPDGQPASAAPAPANRDASLQVLAPVAAAGLSGVDIGVLRTGERLDYYTGARWAQDVPGMLQALLIQALRRRGNFSLVEPDSGAFSARYLLSVDLMHFEADYTGEGPPTVRVALVATLGRRADRSALTTLTVQSSVTAAADRMQQVIAAFEQATNQAIERVAEQLTPPTASEPTS